MHTRFSARDRQRVAYDVAGPADAPAVVLLHDLLCQRLSMAPLGDRLGQSARRVSVDLRGHGASSAISGAAVDLRELALDVAAVLNQEQIATAVLVGHGLGAVVARRLAAEQPSLTTGLVAIEPPLVGPGGESLAETDHRAADLAYKGLTDAALAAYLTPRLGPTWRDDLPRPLAAALRRHVPALATLIPALAVATSGTVDAETIPTVTLAAKPGRLGLAPTTIDAAHRALSSILRLAGT